MKKDHLVKKDDIKIIVDEGIEEAYVFSPLSCESLHGVCQKMLHVLILLEMNLLK